MSGRPRRVLEADAGSKKKYRNAGKEAMDEVQRRYSWRTGRTIVCSDLVCEVRFDLRSFKESPRYVDVHAWEGDGSFGGDMAKLCPSRLMKAWPSSWIRPRRDQKDERGLHGILVLFGGIGRDGHS